MFSLYFDGASRGNPGPASLGGVIYDSLKEEKINYKKAIGVATNNYAEYQALLVGIKVCIKYDIKEVNIYGDSKLVIEQVKGNWKVKSDTLRPIYLEIKKHITPEYFTKITFNHVRRHLNKRADELANVALDNAQ
jgi:ribonuclease HI